MALLPLLAVSGRGEVAARHPDWRSLETEALTRGQLTRGEMYERMMRLLPPSASGVSVSLGESLAIRIPLSFRGRPAALQFHPEIRRADGGTLQSEECYLFENSPRGSSISILVIRDGRFLLWSKNPELNAHGIELEPDGERVVGSLAGPEDLRDAAAAPAASSSAADDSPTVLLAGSGPSASSSASTMTAAPLRGLRLRAVPEPDRAPQDGASVSVDPPPISLVQGLALSAELAGGAIRRFAPLETSADPSAEAGRPDIRLAALTLTTLFLGGGDEPRLPAARGGSNEPTLGSGGGSGGSGVLSSGSSSGGSGSSRSWTERAAEWLARGVDWAQRMLANRSQEGTLRGDQNQRDEPRLASGGGGGGTVRSAAPVLRASRGGGSTIIFDTMTLEEYSPYFSDGELMQGIRYWIHESTPTLSVAQSIQSFLSGARAPRLPNSNGGNGSTGSQGNGGPQLAGGSGGNGSTGSQGNGGPQLAGGNGGNGSTGSQGNGGPQLAGGSGGNGSTGSQGNGGPQLAGGNGGNGSTGSQGNGGPQLAGGSGGNGSTGSQGNGGPQLARGSGGNGDTGSQGNGGPQLAGGSGGSGSTGSRGGPQLSGGSGGSGSTGSQGNGGPQLAGGSGGSG
ncbi:MAG TPA: hypothetical protein VNI01_12265, partial [Elusimicrobiota bacterium]|nr:hypothetical protein [Elusimicrobiota bacterium]